MMSPASASAPEAVPGLEFEDLASTPVPAWARAGRYWRTARALRWSQWRDRLWRKGSQHLYPLWRRLSASCAARRLPPGAFAACYALAPPSREELEDWRAGRFRFLNQARQAGVRGARLEVDWQRGGPVPPPSASHLWLMHLHYFEWAARLQAAGEASLLRELQEDWIRANPLRRPGAWSTAWNSYTIATRLGNWAAAAALDTGAPPPWLLRSAWEQAHCLAAHLEYDLLGNHLIRCLRGLLAAGSWLEGPAPRRWRKVAYQQLPRQVREQVLGDGGHYERAPMYHLRVMEDLAECLALGRANGDCTAGFERTLTTGLAAMAEFAAAVHLGDGQFPLLNDSAAGAEVTAAKALGYVAEATGTQASRPGSGSRFLPDTGLAILEAGPLRVIVDGGELGPAPQPAHAHCDIGSFCASWGRERLIEDTGVYEYQAGGIRDYARSTAAHNTVQMDGLEQGECWDSFRLGRRAKVEAMTCDVAGGVCGVSYRLPQGGCGHRREVRIAPGQLQIDDYLGGRGWRAVAFRLHFAPHLGWEPGPADGLAGEQVRVELAGDPQLHWSRGSSPFFPDFGVHLQRPAWTGTATLKLPAHVRTLVRVVPRPGAGG